MKKRSLFLYFILSLLAGFFFSAYASTNNTSHVDKIASIDEQTVKKGNNTTNEFSHNLPTIHWNEAKLMDNSELLEAEKYAKIATQIQDVKSANVYVFKNNVFITLQLEKEADDSSVILNVRTKCKKNDKNKNFNIFSDEKAFTQMAKSNKVINKTDS